MSATAGRLDREFCAHGFIRAAQYFANMLVSADVLAESRDLVRSIFLPDLVCRFQCAAGGARCDDCPLAEPDFEVLRGAVDQVVETGFMAMEVLQGPMACAAFPVTVRGRTEAAFVIGYAGERALPPHALEALLGVVSLVGATLERQRADRERLALAEERAARAVAEEMAVENARLYQQAQEAIGVRDQFLAVASHELKTPLSALMLVIETLERALERAPGDPAPLRSKVSVLGRQAGRLAQLVNDLLDVTRIQAGRLHVEIEQVDLAAVVREVAERHHQEAARAGCALEVVAPGPVTGAWDPGRVDQVVSNLLSNAIKYGGGRPVSLRAEARGATALLSVTDRGMGIAPEDHERIFQRFERAGGSQGIAGMGLGLWITREIVVRLGGTVCVESRLGAGARFTVELPIGGVDPAAPIRGTDPGA
ncbi:MAG TPA: HAMP domain-containing sensor histidine kinase [Anaeromyxobacteraceae bacterium]|nr:HAMP domain-containing sensor histidine kinase [Anaeromyxobacteraceae bacterium]